MLEIVNKHTRNINGNTTNEKFTQQTENSFTDILEKRSEQDRSNMKDSYMKELDKLSVGEAVEAIEK